MSKELDDIRKENEELESISKEMDELKARKKAIKDAQKKREKANKKYSDMQYALEDKYKELEKTIKGTSKYDDLLKEIAEMEVQVDELREELGKAKYVYDMEVAKASSAEKAAEAPEAGDAPKDPEAGLTKEDLIKLQVYNVSFENLRLDTRMKRAQLEAEGKEPRTIDLRVAQEYQAAIISSLLLQYGDRLNLTEGEKEAYLKGTAADILKTINIQNVFDRSGIKLPELTEITPEISKEVLKDIRKEASIRYDGNIHTPLKVKLQDSLEEAKKDNREELYTYGMNELQSALDASKMEAIMTMGFDAYFNQTSSDYVVVRKNEEGELIVEDTQHSEKTNDFKMALDEDEKDIKEPLLKAAAKLQKEAIKESEETLTVDQQLEIIHKAAEEVIYDLNGADEDIETILESDDYEPTKLDVARLFESEMEKFFEVDESKKRGPIDKIIAKKELRDYIKHYEKVTGVSLGDTKKEKEKALRDEYTRYCLTIAQYEEAKQVEETVENYQAKQQTLNNIHTYEELMASKKYIDRMGLDRVEITTDPRDMFPGGPVPEERLLLHKIAFSELNALGYKETKLDDKPYSLTTSPEGKTVKAREVQVVYNEDFVADLYKELELDLEVGNNEAKQAAKIFGKALADGATAYSEIIAAQDKALGIDSTVLDEFGPEVDAEDEFEEDPKDSPVKPIVKEDSEAAKGAKAFTFASFDSEAESDADAEETNDTDMDEVRKAIEELNAKLGGEYVIKIDKVKEEVKEETAEEEDEM